MNRLAFTATLLVLAACSRTPPSAADDGSLTDTHTDTLPAGLWGSRPARELLAPDFSALNSDGTLRNRDDLIGAPHVIWFFPAAGTPG